MFKILAGLLVVTALEAFASADDSYNAKSRKFRLDEKCGVRLKKAEGLGALNLDALPPSTSNAWQWHNVPGTQCMDGESTGFHVRAPLDSTRVGKKLMIYLQGGGACFSALSCAKGVKSNRYGNFHYDPTKTFTDTEDIPIERPEQMAPAAPDGTNFTSYPIGIFRPSDNEVTNYFDDFTVVYIPYCTGDLFVGNEADGKPPFNPYIFPERKISFCGSYNMQLMMQRIKSTFKGKRKPKELVVMGYSAGGIGAIGSWELIRRRFRNVRKASLISDTGFMLSSTPSFTQGNPSSSLPAIGQDCFDRNAGEVFKPDVGRDQWGTPQGGETLADLYDRVANFKMKKRHKHDKFLMGLAENDHVLSAFFNFGADITKNGKSCDLILNPGLYLLNDTVAVPTEEYMVRFRAGIAQTKAQYWDANSSWESFIVRNEVEHTFSVSSPAELYAAKSKGTWWGELDTDATHKVLGTGTGCPAGDCDGVSFGDWVLSVLSQPRDYTQEYTPLPNLLGEVY